MGSEAHGISPEVEALLHDTFRIARAEHSEAESLNVAVAAGVILHHLSTL
jgi:tRNA G18 (ribose-2'-O)-methylase SpoU